MAFLVYEWSNLIFKSLFYFLAVMTPILHGNASVTHMTATEAQLKSRRKAAKMLCAVVIFFAVCYLPVHFLSIFG